MGSVALLCAILIWAAPTACAPDSADGAPTGSSNGSSNPSNGDSGGNNGGNSGEDPSDDLAIPTGPSDMPPPDVTGPVVDAPLLDCMTNADCCPQDPECMDAAEYICTIDNKCGKVSGTCTEQAQCNSDTYCCVGPECRADGEATGACIPANVPPFLECGNQIGIGVFSPAVQCEWLGPAAGDPAPNSKFVLTTPMVADLPTDAGASAEIVVISTADSPAENVPVGDIRILSGQDCTLLATISDPRIRGNSAPALADLDADGDIDIVTRQRTTGAIAFKWENGAYTEMWASAGGHDYTTAAAWDGVAVHDLDNDGVPEVLVRDAVYNGQTGALLAAEVTGNTPTYFAFNGIIPLVGDFDGDMGQELFSTVSGGGLNYFQWTAGAWAREYMSINGQWFGASATHFAAADFTGDGMAEVVAVSSDEQSVRNGHVALYNLDGQVLWEVTTTWDETVANKADALVPYEGGGPPVIADFDGDGKPEVGVAGATRFRVFDDDCAMGGAGCEAPYVRWSRPSQDASSHKTGASVFDFDGDGAPEAVYADECFLRVYAGATGEVLFSAYRMSSTWYENPVIADVDKDENTEIVVNNAYGEVCPLGGMRQPYVDPLHAGVRCDDDMGCLPGASCVNGYCRCTGSGTSQCCPEGQTLEECGLTCGAPPPASADVLNPPSAADGNVCRATHPNPSPDEPISRNGGIRVLRDRLDRWPSSRPMWNQQAYSITNVLDDGKIPTGDWRNWVATNQEGVAYNNYRQNRQGVAGVEDLPDITGKFTDDEPCVRGASGNVFVQARVCNRGKRAVGAALPATFYRGDPANNDVLCTSYTDGPVPTPGCKLVYCQISGDVIGQDITLIVNRDQNGVPSTVECREENNFSSTQVMACPVDPIR